MASASLTEMRYAKPDKFRDEDLPKILTAIQEARGASLPGTVVIQFAGDGGVISVVREGKKKYK